MRRCRYPEPRRIGIAQRMLQGAQRRSPPNHQHERCKRVRHVSCGGRLRVAHLVGSGRWSAPSDSKWTWVTHFRQGKGGSTSCRTQWKNATCVRHYPHCLLQNALSFGLRVDPLSSRPFVCCPTSRTQTQGKDLPGLVGEGERAKLVTLAGEVGGRWSNETANFLRALAVAKARDATNVLQACVELAWFRRWSSILSCAAARAFV